MLRQRIARQSALENISGSDSLESSSNSICGISSFTPGSYAKNQIAVAGVNLGQRRHSIACGTIVIDAPKSSFKSTVNSVLRRMSSAYSLMSSHTSPDDNTMDYSTRKAEQVMLPSVLDTFKQVNKPDDVYNCNRRFSTDFAPPSYKDATNTWKIPHFPKCQQSSGASVVNDLTEKSSKRDSSGSESEHAEVLTKES